MHQEATHFEAAAKATPRMPACQSLPARLLAHGCFVAALLVTQRARCAGRLRTCAGEGGPDAVYSCTVGQAGIMENLSSKVFELPNAVYSLTLQCSPGI